VVPGALVVLLLVSAGFAIFGITRTWTRVAPWLRLMAQAPRCLAANVRPGLVRVDGVAQCKETLTSPVHQAACIGYSVKVEEMVGRGKKSKWITRHEESQILPFEIVDPSGRAKVEVGPETALEFVRERAVGQDLLNELPAHVETYARAHGAQLQGRIYRSTVRVREWRLDAGETCMVMGEGRREADPSEPATGYREAPTIGVIAAGGQGLYVADRTGKVVRRDLRRRLAGSFALAIFPIAVLVFLVSAFR